MKISITFEDVTSEQIDAAIAAVNGTGAEVALSLAPANIAETDFPDVPDVTEKPKKTRKTTEKKFVDPGDKVPEKPVDPFATPAPAPAAENVELDDFGDPIVKTAPPVNAAPPINGVVITIDLLRTTMQSKSTISPAKKAACQALIASYNVQTMSMIPEALWPELYEKIRVI